MQTNRTTKGLVDYLLKDMNDREESWRDRWEKKYKVTYNMKPEKSTDYFMVDCLFDEMQGALSHHRFTDWEKKFIKDLNSRFFNDPDMILTPAQKESLEKIWKKD